MERRPTRVATDGERRNANFLEDGYCVNEWMDCVFYHTIPIFQKVCITPPAVRGNSLEWRNRSDENHFQACMRLGVQMVGLASWFGFGVPTCTALFSTASVYAFCREARVSSSDPTCKGVLQAHISGDSAFGRIAGNALT
eukprot:2024499-Pyramimonas_sp.AAC.2